MNNISAIVIKKISKLSKIPQNSIAVDADILFDIGLDSVDLTVLTMELEDTFNITLLDDDISDLKKVSDIASLINGKLN